VPRRRLRGKGREFRLDEAEPGVGRTTQHNGPM
jgi:hypothetical protein